MSAYEELEARLRAAPRKWLVTGAAGFIGSNLLETLLAWDQFVIGLDNFATGHRHNLEETRARLRPEQWDRFRFIEGDIGDPGVCRSACAGVSCVLHEAAFVSVPGSMADPQGAHQSNVTGFLNILLAAREAGVKRIVYASSSAVYGDEPNLPKVEEKTGAPLSPYALTKFMDEQYAALFARAWGVNSVGLRYFNVFGPRQDPEGAYAAVIPKWLDSLLKNEPVYINGDGETTRDFCFIANVVQANLLAATTDNAAALNQVYNIALGQRTSLNELFGILQRAIRRAKPALPPQQPVYRDFRPGDVRHSVADIGKARRLLGFEPTVSVEQGLDLAMNWYLTQ